LPLHLLYKHQNVPREYAEYRLDIGPDKKYNDDGSVKRPLKNHERHHSLHCAAGFEVKDGMTEYRFIRTGAKEERSYGLDARLEAHGIPGKVKIPVEGAPEDTGPWHEFMRHHAIDPYMVYASWDARGMTKLDQKILDMRLTLPSMIRELEARFSASSTRAVMTYMRGHFLNAGQIPSTKYNYDDAEIAAMTPERRHELGLDAKVFHGRKWILTLSNHMLDDNGLQCIMEFPNKRTKYYLGVADIDIVSSYPTITEILNASKDTLCQELCEAVGIDEYVFRNNVMGLTIGVDAVRYCTELHNMVTPMELLDM